VSSLDPELFAGWPLHRAAFAGQVDLIESLVAEGHDPNAMDGEDWTPLFLARTEAAVRTLLRLGADPGHVTQSGETVLMAVARIGSPEALEALVTTGHVDPNYGDTVGDTALMEAAWAGRADNVEKLIGLHAKPDAKTRSGQTALNAAISEGHADVQAVLERHLAHPGDS
jgi:ankyrin repeat protein